MWCEICEGSMRLVRSESNGKREVWRCRKPGCPGEEVIKLMGPVVEVKGNMGDGKVEVNTDGKVNTDERRGKMAKKSGLASVVGESKETKEEKKERMKAAREAKKAEKAKEAEVFAEERATKTGGKKAKKPEPKAAPKDCALCPCCGKRTTSPKSLFLMGHDGRMKGWFSKKAKGKLEGVEFNAEQEKMWKMWKKNPDMKIKDIVKKVRGIKE